MLLDKLIRTGQGHCEALHNHMHEYYPMLGTQIDTNTIEHPVSARASTLQNTHSVCEVPICKMWMVDDANKMTLVRRALC